MLEFGKISPTEPAQWRLSGMVEKSANTQGRGGANVDLADLHRAIAQGLYAASASLVCGETQATRVRIKLYGGALSYSFAIEGAAGEWEIVQARAPRLVGARIVKPDAPLALLEIGAHEWGQALAFAAPPAGALESDARASHLTRTLPHAAARPWAPAHVRAKRPAGGDVAISWIGAAPFWRRFLGCRRSADWFRLRSLPTRHL